MNKDIAVFDQDATEEYMKAIKDFNEKNGDLLCRLYERWLNEKEYEDFEDYRKCIKEKIPNVVKVSKKPFSVFFTENNHLYEIRVKATKTRITLDGYVLR